MILIEKKASPLIGVIKKILISFITLIMLVTPIMVYSNASSLETGNPRYVVESYLGEERSIDLDSYIEEIANRKVAKLSNSAEINNWNFDKNGFITEVNMVKNPNKDSKTLTEQVEAHIKLTYNQYELKILKDGSIYYFKTEQEANDFKNKIEENVEISKVEVSNLDKISKQEDLDKKVADLKAEKEKEKSIQVAKVTSRSGTSRRDSSGSAPITNYKYISSYYRTEKRPSHTGVDFAATKGTQIYAYKSGTVVRASWNGGYGKCIEIQHSNGVKTRYAHCSGFNVSVGQQVSQGQLIGFVGSTGNSTGPHLHFEIMINGSFVNPLNYI